LDQQIELFDISVHDIVAKMAVSPLGVGNIEQYQQTGEPGRDGASELFQRIHGSRSPRHAS
jgi:hypothetical protein